MKKIIVFLSVLSSLLLCTSNVYAAESNSYQLEMDLSQPEYQSFGYYDEFENDIVLTVEPIESFARISSGTYKVSKTIKNNWVTTYTVTINNNKQFISADNMIVTAINGNISSKSLTYSSNKVIGKFKHKYGIITTTPSITTTIVNNKLTVK